MFYDPTCDNDFIKSLNLSAYSKTVHAFTVKSTAKGINAVLIDGTLSATDKLCSMLHETAHICLKHLEENKAMCDPRRQEMQAEAFAHEVLNLKKSNVGLYALFIISALLLITPLFCISRYKTDPTTEKAKTKAVPETVYITQTGEKYHRENCIYVRGKNCTEMLKAQADKRFMPCLVCNP